jgi:hypothetical protein
MRIRRIGGALVALGVAGLPAFAQQSYGQSLQQPASYTSYTYDAYAQDEEAESPSDEPPAPEADEDSFEAETDAMKHDAEEESEMEECDECAEAEEEGPYRIFSGCWLDEHNITIAGWANGGYTWNPDNPANGYNVPVTFQDRANEGQLNQLYGYMEKALDTECGFDVGGRVDLLYGTDYWFTTALGLETESDGTQKWNRDKPNDPVRGAAQYGLAMPQLYADFGYYNLSVKVGHYYAPVGYQAVTAPSNFFITQPYTFQYGEPFTLTGALATYKLNDRVSVIGGIDRGWDKWEDDNGNLSGLVGFYWTSRSGKTSVAWAGFSGNETGVSGITGNRSLSAVVVTYNITDKWQYVFQNDIGWQDDGAQQPFGGPAEDEEWYGINQYLFYSVNDCWKVGVRGEWFRDDDGARVNFFDQLSDNAGNWYEVALGANYYPNKNVTFRTEARWDWSDASLPPSAGTGSNTTLYPYDDFSQGSQFIWTTDVIVQY